MLYLTAVAPSCCYLSSPHFLPFLLPPARSLSSQALSLPRGRHTGGPSHGPSAKTWHPRSACVFFTGPTACEIHSSAYGMHQNLSPTYGMHHNLSPTYGMHHTVSPKYGMHHTVSPTYGMHHTLHQVHSTDYNYSIQLENVPLTTSIID